MSPSPREEFGDYLLLKKLGEDPLGETFRAGRVGPQGVEQVVLLRVLNGEGMPAGELSRGLAERGVVQQALKSPNIGNGVDLGEVRGLPFLAYDYISGKNLAALLKQAADQSSAIPADLALLIAERVALALAVAYETRVQEERILHGFLVPQLVMLSNEGETRVLGFEAGPLLNRLAAGGGSVSPELAPYLAPEVRSGAELAKSDDVYSLGAILFELLTGKRLPTSGIDPATLIAEATSAQDEQPLSPAVASLLEKSLAPREARIAEAVAWHKAVSKVMVESSLNATTFNLAFFMHNLFRSEIERESQEIEVEKTLSLPARSRPTAEPEEGTGTAPEIGEAALSHAEGSPSGEPGTKKGLLLGLAAVLVLAVLGGAYWLFLGPGSQPAAPPKPAVTEETPPPPPTTAPAPSTSPEGEASTAEAAPAGPSPDEIQTQISQMIEARSKEMEAQFKEQYDSRIQKLQRQLEETRAAAEKTREEERRRAEAQPPEPAKTTVGKAAERSPEPTEPSDSGATQPSTAATTSDHAAVPGPGSTSGPSTASTGEGNRQPATSGGSVPPTVTQKAPPPAPAPPPPKPAQIVPPRLIRNPEPRYPPLAKRVNAHATVEVRVRVDARGNVVQAERIGEKARFGFDQAALEAAREARFAPGTRDGVPVPMWYTLKIQFKP